MAFWLLTHRRLINIIFWTAITILFLVLMIPNSKDLSVTDWLIAIAGYAFVWYLIKTIVFWLILRASRKDKQ